MNGERIFNTGKVAIGSQYQAPKQVPYMDKDALRLQRAYLDKPQIDWDGIGIVAFVLLVVVMAVIVYAIGGAA